MPGFLHQSLFVRICLCGAASLGSLTACGSDSAEAGDQQAGGSSGSGGAGASGGTGAAGGAGGSGATGGSATGGSSGTGGSGATGGSAGTSSDAGTDGPPDGPPPGEYGTRAELLEANSEMAVAELDGKIYVLGGYPSNRQTQATVQVYDTRTDTWSLARPLPVPLHHPVAATVGGKLYSLGGQTDAGDIAHTLEYDPATNEWLDLAPMPTARGAGASAVIGDLIYVVAGRPGAGNAFEAYDVSENAWNTLPDLPNTFPDRNHIAVGAIGGKVYAAGGRYDGGGFNSPMTDSLDVYDPALGRWETGANMLRPRGGVNGVMAFGCFHVFGGEGTNTGEPNDVFPDHDVYNPIENTWTALAPLPTPVHGVTGAAFVNGLIYIPGGGTSSGGASGSRIFQVYRPATRCE